MLTEQIDFFSKELKLLETVEKCFCSNHRVEAPKPVLAIDADQTLLVSVNGSTAQTYIPDTSKITPGDFVYDPLPPYPLAWLARTKMSAQVLAARRKGLKVVVITQGPYTRDNLYTRWQTDEALEEWQYQLVADRDHFFLLNARNEELRKTLIENEACAEFFLEEYFSKYSRPIEELEKEEQEGKTHLQSKKNLTPIEIVLACNKMSKLQLRKKFGIFKKNFTIEEARQILSNRSHQERKRFIQNLLDTTTLMIITPINKKLILAFWLAIQGVPFNESTAKNIILVDDLKSQNDVLTLYPFNKIKFVHADIIINQLIAEGEISVYNPNYTYLEGIREAIKELFSTSAVEKNFYEAIELLSSSEIRKHIFECIPADCPDTQHFAASHLPQAFASKIIEMRGFLTSLQSHKMCYQANSSASVSLSSSSSVNNGTYKAIETCPSLSQNFLTESKAFYTEYTSGIKEFVKGERKIRQIVAGFKTPEEMMESKICRTITEGVESRYQPAVKVKKGLSKIFAQLKKTALQSIPLIFDAKTENKSFAIQKNFCEIVNRFFCPQVYEIFCCLIASIHKLDTEFCEGDVAAARALEDGIVSILSCIQNYATSFLNGTIDNSAQNLLSKIDEIARIPLLNEKHGCGILNYLCYILSPDSCSCSDSSNWEIILLRRLLEVCRNNVTGMSNAQGKTSSPKRSPKMPPSLFTAPTEVASSTSSGSSQKYSCSTNSASVSTSVSFIVDSSDAKPKPKYDAFQKMESGHHPQ